MSVIQMIMMASKLKKKVDFEIYAENNYFLNYIFKSLLISSICWSILTYEGNVIIFLKHLKKKFVFLQLDHFTACVSTNPLGKTKDNCYVAQCSFWAEPLSL